MKRAYYKKSISEFLKEDESSITGHLLLNYSNRNLQELQKNAWLSQVKILKNQLYSFEGYIYFEFVIPRLGKRVDNIIIIDDCIFVVEFKVGTNIYEKHAQEQVIDYSLDLKNFHQGSHNAKLIPLLIATNAEATYNDITLIRELERVAKCNKKNIKDTIKLFLENSKKILNVLAWENSIYKPTPTIVEAAKALYKGHNVKEISRSDSGAINLSKMTECLNRIIEHSKSKNKKSICFVTGVPGAGKTLAGLNIANERMKTDEDEHAVFLSGNGPLVEVLREALARDLVKTTKENGDFIKKENARRKTNAFIQNIHHFRDEYLNFTVEPTEKVVVFDEAQRAWTQKEVATFMKRKKGKENFKMSEPEFLVDVMNRHHDWCTIICLIGGGQEINRGEAGLEGWLDAFRKKYKDWSVHYSNSIVESKSYIKSKDQKEWLKKNAFSEKELHLAVSLRSFRSEKLAQFIYHLLEVDIQKAQRIYLDIQKDYPIFVTRDLILAKKWLHDISKGTERTGLIASSGARRLKALGINVKNEISAPIWFLNSKDDIRASNFLEEIATEFDIQGLEIDWSCIAWGGNFHIRNNRWKYQNFRGSEWMNINKEVNKEYLKNTYRVLLTRARQGMIIYIPSGSKGDITRPKEYYDGTYEYLKSIGIKEINER